MPDVYRGSGEDVRGSGREWVFRDLSCNESRGDDVVRVCEGNTPLCRSPGPCTTHNERGATTTREEAKKLRVGLLPFRETLKNITGLMDRQVGRGNCRVITQSTVYAAESQSQFDVEVYV